MADIKAEFQRLQLSLPKHLKLSTFFLNINFIPEKLWLMFNISLSVKLLAAFPLCPPIASDAGRPTSAHTGVLAVPALIEVTSVINLVTGIPALTLTAGVAALAAPGVRVHVEASGVEHGARAGGAVLRLAGALAGDAVALVLQVPDGLQVGG